MYVDITVLFISLISTCYVNAHTFFPRLCCNFYAAEKWKKNCIDLCVPLVYTDFFSGGLLLLFSLLVSNIVAALWQSEAHIDDGNIVKIYDDVYFLKSLIIRFSDVHEKSL